MKVESMIVRHSLFFLLLGMAGAVSSNDEGGYWKDLGGQLAAASSKTFKVGVSEKGGDTEYTIFYPKGSYDPGSMKRYGLPLGGVSEKIDLGQSFECLTLGYDVKFSTGFDFVRGGKLPGLAGGTANTGGLIPNGYDGFSMRFLWLGQGGGAVYAYLPTSKVWGDSLGSNNWNYQAGRWHRIFQKVELNEPGRSNGKVLVYFDGQLVYLKTNVLFRKTIDLKIDSFLLSSFFGGNTEDYSAKNDSYVHIRRVIVSNLQCLG